MSTKTNLILDVTIFIAFLVAANPALSGLPIHEWLSLAFVAAIVTHLLFHWKWIVNVTTQFFRKLFHESRLNYVVDVLFFIMMTAAIFTGFMVSQTILPIFGIHMPEHSVWGTLHHQTSDLSVLLLGLHFALHWKWIVNAVGRYIVNPLRGLFSRPEAGGAPQMTPVAVEVEHK